MLRVLVVAPSWVGDLIMTQSFLKSIKAQYPESSIDVLAPAWCLELVERMPEVNTAIVSPFKHGQFALMQRWKFGTGNDIQESSDFL